MMEFIIPAAYAVLIWWFTTGLILFLDGLPQRTFPLSMGSATAVLAAAVYFLQASTGDITVQGAYTAFTCTILVWGWLEMTFLMGYITGPRRHSCSDNCSGWRHFLHAAAAIIYNELAALATAAIIAVATWHAANRLSLYTYLILWAMRLSAKLNLFFGVPNVGEAFLPPHLQYLKSFFRKRSMNLLFPFSIIASTAVVMVLGRKFIAADDAFNGTQYALTTSLLALAVLEHWFMVLPLPSEKMWAWALRRARPVAP